MTLDWLEVDDRAERMTADVGGLGPGRKSSFDFGSIISSIIFNSIQSW